MKRLNLTQNEWGFYGGNFVERDANRGFCIKMEYGESIYLDYHEAQSLASLLYRLIIKRNNGSNKTNRKKTKEK